MLCCVAVLVGDESSSLSIDSKRLSALRVVDELLLGQLGLRKKSKSSALTAGTVTSEKLSLTDTEELALLVGEGQCHLAACKPP